MEAILTFVQKHGRRKWPREGPLAFSERGFHRTCVSKVVHLLQPDSPVEREVQGGLAFASC